MDKISGDEGCISLGPWGGKAGKYWAYKLDGPILQITICYGNVIDSILFESKSRDGVVIERSRKIGGTYGGWSAKFCIDSSVEQFSSVSLTYKKYKDSKDYYGLVVVTSLCFNTNLKKYGPFGLGDGHSLFIPLEGEVITGFHGLDGSYLYAIGIFVAPKVDSFPNSDSMSTQLKKPNTATIRLSTRKSILIISNWVQWNIALTYCPDLLGSFFNYHLLLCKPH